MPDRPDLNAYLASFAPEATGPQSQEEIQYNRVLKLMVAMGLDPEAEGSHGVFFGLTGRTPGQLSRDFDEWERATPVKNWFGRNIAQKMLNKSSLDKYHEIAKQRRILTEAELKRTEPEFPWYRELAQPRIEQLRSVEQKLGDPKTLPQLEEWFQQIRRPHDIDKIPVPYVTSKIVPTP